MSVRDELIQAMDRCPKPFDGSRIRIDMGWDAWDELKTDSRTIHELSLIDDLLFFKGVEINPFADIGRDSWELVAKS